jgi:hypothetical protein
MSDPATVPPYSYAFGINNRGQIVGYTASDAPLNAGAEVHGYLLRNGPAVPSRPSTSPARWAPRPPTATTPARSSACTATPTSRRLRNQPGRRWAAWPDHRPSTDPAGPSWPWRTRRRPRPTRPMTAPGTISATGENPSAWQPVPTGDCNSAHNSPPSQDRQPPGGDGAVSAGGPSHCGQSPQPGHQRPSGLGGHRCARAPRAAAGAAGYQAGRHGRAARAWPDPDHHRGDQARPALLSERCAALEAELARLDAELDHLTAQAAPRLRQLCGVGPEIAGALLVADGDNPGRLHSEAAFSMLCGASPIPASSGKTVRHRLNRGGNRQANTALYRIVGSACAGTSRPATI